MSPGANVVGAVIVKLPTVALIAKTMVPNVAPFFFKSSVSVAAGPVFNSAMLSDKLVA